MKDDSGACMERIQNDPTIQEKSMTCQLCRVAITHKSLDSHVQEETHRQNVDKQQAILAQIDDFLDALDNLQ